MPLVVYRVLFCAQVVGASSSEGFLVELMAIGELAGCRVIFFLHSF